MGGGAIADGGLPFTFSVSLCVKEEVGRKMSSQVHSALLDTHIRYTLRYRKVGIY